MRRWSPYNHAFNNPLRFIDPDGMAPMDIIIGGPDKQKALTELQTTVQGHINLSMDANGKVSYTAAAPNALMSKEAQALMTAIDDHSVQVNLTTTTATSATVAGANGPVTGNIVVGAYGGSAVQSGVTVTNQIINMNQASVEGKVGGLTTGENVLHETTESYYAAKATPGDKAGGPGYGPAHQKAAALTPNINNVTYKQDPVTGKYSVSNNKTGATLPIP